MRGDPRGDERIVISLEQRQLFFVLMGVLVLASGILVVGYVLGRRFAGPEPKTAGQTLAEAEADETVDVTFRKKLVEPSEPLTRPPVPPPKPEAKEKPKPEAKPEAKPPPKAEAKPPPKAEAKPPPKAEAKPAAKVEAKPAPKPPADPLAERVEAVTGDAMKALRKLNDRGAGGGRGVRFTLQVSAFQDRAEAVELMERLRKRGHNPYLTSSVLEGRGRWYRVRVGKFSDREAAEEYKRRFEASEKVTTFVTRL